MRPCIVSYNDIILNDITINKLKRTKRRIILSGSICTTVHSAVCIVDGVRCCDIVDSISLETQNPICRSNVMGCWMCVQNKCGRCSYFRLGSLNIERSLHLLNSSIRVGNQKEVIMRSLYYLKSSWSKIT